MIASPSNVQHSIAIVGIAAQLPSGEAALNNLDHKEFFDFLLNKGEAYERIPLERFNIDSYKGKHVGQVSTELGTFLKHTDQLDHVEFGITNKDAKAMSLSTRKLIELSFLALLDSGIDYRGQNVGCFASGIVFDVLSLSEPDPFEARGSFGGPPAMIANRISYHLDLVGPSVPVDTACSSSLTATHLAVQSIRSGDCDSAVVAGIQLNHRFVDWVQYSQGGILAPDGKCKPFDVSANGFSRGEAGVAIVLKRLDQAVKDNDHIYATILGTGINSAGSAAPVNAPVASAQRDAMRRAWSQTGRDPSEVDFVELHATGTAAGDPAEANWVGEAFHREDELLVGSVKGNIGHTEIAAFLSSLTKAVNIFRTGTIPPNVNFFTPNPLINWEKYHLHVPTECIPLPCHSTTGRSLISLCSSGIGGANGHVVLEAPPIPSKDSEVPAVAKPLLLVAGALSPRSATTMSETISELISTHPERSRHISTVYGRRSKQMPWRSFCISSPGLNNRIKFSTPVLVPRIKPPIVFVFAGQGPQHLEMGRELFKTYPAFRESIVEMDQVYWRVTGTSLIASTGLFNRDTNTIIEAPLGDIWPIAVTLPALAMLQCALVDLLSSVGVSPDIVVGHSAGETSVLYSSGAGSKAMVIELAIARGKAMAAVEEAGGTMAAISCGVSEAYALIAEALEPHIISSVDVACHNSREAVTISGLACSIDKVVVLAESKGIMARKLKTRVPVHSKMMELCHTEFKQMVEEMWTRYPGTNMPKLPVYSTLTGGHLAGPFTSDYFWDGTRGPVLFSEGITALLKDHSSAIFMEISPHPVLGSYLSALGATSVIAPLRRPKRNETSPVEVSTFLNSLGQLSVLGLNLINFSALNDHPTLDHDFQLPPYPFIAKSVPYHSESLSFYRQLQDRKGPMNYTGLRINSQTHPILAQHVIKGEPIMPAAGFIEMALEFGAMELWNVEFRAMLSLSGEHPVPIEVKLDGLHWTVKTASASTSQRKHDSSFDKVHAEGYLSFDSPKTKCSPLNLCEIVNRCKRFDLTDFYKDLKTFAEYGPEFQRVIDGYHGENEVLVLVRGDDDLMDVDGYCFHPAILDSCLHFMVHKAFTLNNDSNVYYLPSQVGKLTMHQALVDFGLPDRVYAHIVFKAWTPTTIVADFYIVAVDGTHLCTLAQVEVERHESSPRVAVAQRYDVAFQPLAVPVVALNERPTVVSEHEDMRQLYKYLDHLARQVIVSTLHSEPTTGKELDRERYMKFSATVAASFVPEDTKFDETMVTKIRQKYPEMIEVTNRVASVHKKIYETSKAAVEVLYKDDIMTRFYKHYDWASEACASRFRSVLSKQVEGGKRVIRVLEVGAGTGALTRHLAKVMEEFHSAVIEFVVSDVSKELLPRMTYPRCRYKSFDLSKSPVTQGFDLASFDIITGFHVLHVVADLVPSLAALNTLLVPGGSLLIGDLHGDSWASGEPGSIWFDFVFGSFQEWFSFTDDRSHCTMSTQEWQKYLQSAGFGHVFTEGFATDPLLFTLEAQKLHSSTHMISLSTKEAGQLIFHYRRGNEGLLRDEIAAYDPSSPLSIWLFARSGFNGNAGMGFSRSIGREYPLWEVHFAIFDGSRRSEDEMWNFVSRLSRNPGQDSLLFIDEKDTISVPRVVPSATPLGKRPFQPSLPWLLTDSRFTQTSIPSNSQEYVTVEVMAMSRPENELRAFVGRVSSGVSVASGKGFVVGLVSSQGFSNYVSAHPASLAYLDVGSEEVAVEIAGATLGLVIGSLASGVSILKSSRRRRGGKALLLRGSDAVVPSLKWFLRLVGFEIVEGKSVSPADIAEMAYGADLILSGSQDPLEYQALSPALARKCRTFMWNDAHSGLGAILKDDPSAIGEALDFIIENMDDRWPQNNNGIGLNDIPLPNAGSPVPSSASLFDCKKAYVLVGGIGGLGIRVALWMYEKGARYIVLTSRSGEGSLSRVQDRLALRIIAYLQTLPDLTLRLEASDATSKKATSKLLQSIPVQLGGCMLLTVVLSDRTFAFQQDQDFNRVFASKTGACSVLDSCIPGGISTLDFFIPFSSVVGLFGNGGQTNYSSANTALDGMVRTWDNAFTFILPAVTDGGGLASETREQGGRLGHLTPWGMSSQRICDCLEDGIRKLADGPFWQYIPDLDWNLVQKHIDSSPLFGHLIGTVSEEGPTHAIDAGKTMSDVVIELLDVDPSEFSEDVPFTAYGLDSLSAARLSFALRSYVTVSQLQLLSDISLTDLRLKVERFQKESSASEGPSVSPSTSLETNEVDTRVAEMERLIAKYTSEFPKYSPSNQTSHNDEVVLITGTTGAIGTSMLAQLASMPSITRIYAFNRGSCGSSNLRDRQALSLKERGYDPKILERGTIVLVEGDQSRYDLGLPVKLYEEIRSSVTSIVHNAWPVNFTSSLASLESSIRSVRAFVDLALKSSRPRPPRLLFLSSIGLFYNRKSSGPAPEDSIKDGKQVVGTGYSESKWVGERILERAAEATPLRPIIVRAGQVCGGINGSWSTSEWFPTLVKSAMHLNALPGADGGISWIPLDTAAKSLIEMRDAEHQILHLSHPRPVQWSMIADFLSKTLQIPIIPYKNWLTRLEESAGSASLDSTSAEGSENPALRLLYYFRALEVGTNEAKEALGLPKLGITQGTQASATLRDAEPLTCMDAAHWINSWETAGFLRV